MNNDLISRAAAIAEIEEYIEEYSELEPETGYHNLKWCAMEEAKDVLSMLPAVDAAPVVRCKDCKNWDSSTEGRYVGGWCFCEKLQFSTSPDWFCADGEPEEMRPRSACGQECGAELEERHYEIDCVEPESVPLRPLCQWLAGYAMPPLYAVPSTIYTVDKKTGAQMLYEAWRKVIKNMMDCWLLREDGEDERCVQQIPHAGDAI